MSGGGDGPWDMRLTPVVNFGGSPGPEREKVCEQVSEVCSLLA